MLRGVNKLLAQRSLIKTHHMLRVSLRKGGCSRSELLCRGWKLRTPESKRDCWCGVDYIPERFGLRSKKKGWPKGAPLRNQQEHNARPPRRTVPLRSSVRNFGV